MLLLQVSPQEPVVGTSPMAGMGGTCPFEAAFDVWGTGIAGLVLGAKGVVLQ